MADCAQCGKAVLTYVALDDDGAERRICVHCDTPIAENLKWVSPGELEQSGYYFGPPPAEGRRRADAVPAAAVAASRRTERAGLAQSFIHDNRHGVREIQAAHAWLEDWNPIRAVNSLGYEIPAKA